MSKLTKWEIGQDLIAVSDYFAENHSDICDQLTAQDNDKLLKARALIGDVFNNENNDHSFGIYDTESYLSKKETFVNKSANTENEESR